eukprot:COSAG01_NODE_2755_length_7137_cov_3.530548_2_plen_432_part_00
MGDIDRSLLDWIRTYLTGHAGYTMGNWKPTRVQRVSVVGWVFVQLCIPLRMPLISSGEFSRTAEGYRYSWTMMLHSKTMHMEGPTLNAAEVLPPPPPGRFNVRDFKKLEEFPLQIPLFYLAPIVYDSSNIPTPGSVVSGAVVPQQGYHLPRMSAEGGMGQNGFQSIPRSHYMPVDAPFEDERTLPLNNALGVRHRALLGLFPRQLMRVAGGFARLIQLRAPAGQRVGVRATLFVQLNGHGLFSRLIDPTIDLALANDARKARTWPEVALGVLTDSMPPGHEFILRRSGASMPAAEADALALKLSKTRFGSRAVHLLADRSSCLHGNPLWLKALGSRVEVLLLKAPNNGNLVVNACATKHGHPCKQRTLRVQHKDTHSSHSKKHSKDTSMSRMKKCWSLEISFAPSESTRKPNSYSTRCRDSAEDLLFAIVL